MVHQMGESPMPPVRIYLTFENVSSGQLTFGIWEFNSELGNFAVRPDKLALAPGQKATPDAMTSKLGLTSGELPMTLVLRANGKEETKVIRVKQTQVQ